MDIKLIEDDSLMELNESNFVKTEMKNEAENKDQQEHEKNNDQHISSKKLQQETGLSRSCFLILLFDIYQTEIFTDKSDKNLIESDKDEYHQVDLMKSLKSKFLKINQILLLNIHAKCICIVCVDKIKIGKRYTFEIESKVGFNKFIWKMIKKSSHRHVLKRNSLTSLQQYEFDRIKEYTQMLIINRFGYKSTLKYISKTDDGYKV